SYWQEEVDASYLYHVLASKTENEIQRAAFFKLSEIEKKHEAAWKKLLEDKGIHLPESKPTFKAKIMAFTQKYLGNKLLITWMQKEESTEVKSYLNLYKLSSDGKIKDLALDLARDSAGHAGELGVMNGTTGEPWHRTESGGMLRNVVYGFNDGLTANFGLIAGVIGAGAAPHFILLSGLAGALADALSMASSGYLAAKSEKDVYEKERRMEEDEILLMPELETEELAALYESKGIHRDEALSMAQEIMKNPQLALEEQVREELGISVSEISPLKEAWVTGLATAIGAVIPVFPFLFTSGITAIWLSFSLAMITHFGVGAARSFFTGKGLWKSGWEMLLVGFGVAGAGFLLGEWLIKFMR
ncbi:MAG: VIT1/CCC1 transporter family protein, partial [Ginsengibacter sp.]